MLFLCTEIYLLLRAVVRSTALHCSAGERAIMEMWKILFGLLFTCWHACSIGLISTNANVIISEDKPGDLCSTFVRPYYSKYDCQEFKTTTLDGFILGVQRINSRSFPSDSNEKEPIFLNHGVLAGGEAWVTNPPDQSDVSPAFVLADAGYDVWVGNARTTNFSYGHEYLTKQDEAYWNWSLDELASLDLPSMMHLVNNITNKKVHFIGHSQGTQTALAALSEGLLVNIVNKVALLAPIAYISRFTTPIGVAAVDLGLDQVLEGFGALGIYSFSTKTTTGQQLVDLICLTVNLNCVRDINSAYTGINCCVNNSRIRLYETPQATSSKNLVHLAQLYRADKFQKYDYGAAENERRYNSIYPPLYDLSKVPTQNLFIASGDVDPLADLQDVQRLRTELRPGYKYILKPKFAHLDFVFAINCKQLLYDNVIAFFQNKLS